MSPNRPTPKPSNNHPHHHTPSTPSPHHHASDALSLPTPQHTYQQRRGTHLHPQPQLLGKSRTDIAGTTSFRKRFTKQRGQTPNSTYPGTNLGTAEFRTLLLRDPLPLTPLVPPTVTLRSAPWSAPHSACSRPSTGTLIFCNRRCTTFSLKRKVSQIHMCLKLVLCSRVA